MPAAGPGARVLRLEDLVFVGFNSRVAALDRYDGTLRWSWKSPKGTGFVALLLDGDRLIASVQGYTYCIDPLSGLEVWRNTLKGFGVGVTSIASVHGASAGSAIAEAQAQQARRNAAASGGAPTS